MENDVKPGQKYRVALSPNDANDVRVMAHGFIDAGSSVLDVGCACGDFGSLLFSHKACRIYGLDFDADSLVVAEESKSYEHLEQVDCNRIGADFHPEWAGCFDYITFLDVLEHLIDPQECLNRILTFLKPDGDVIISLPNLAFGDIKLLLMNDEFSYTDTGILDRTHLRFFTYKSIAVFLAKAGLVVVDAGFKLSGLDRKLRDATGDELLSRVCEDPHSFVYQYVTRCKRSDLSVAELTSINLAKLNVAHADIKPRLLVLGVRSMLATAFPSGSKWRHILRRARSALCVGRS